MVVFDELFDSTCQQISVIVASFDHGTRRQYSISLVLHVTYDHLSLLILEAMHFGDGLILVDQHEWQAVGLSNVPGCPLCLVAQIDNQIA